MAFLSGTDWRAIKWYASECGFKVKDMTEGPIIVFRNANNEKIKVNIADVKTKYAGRPKKKPTRKTAS